MNIVLISTSNVAKGCSDALVRMLASVAAVRAARPDLVITLFLLLQEADPAKASPIADEHLQFTQVTAEAQRLSLSRARNILLDQACAKAISDDCIVAFPDDDCWYPPGALAEIADGFAKNPTLDFWFCRYASKPVALDRSLERDASAVDVVRRASSNTIVMRGRLVRALAHFDEDLGVGTPSNGAEDTDFAIAGFRRARQSVYLDAACIGHRDHNWALRAKYYPAALLVIARHSAGDGKLTLELLRKIAIGVVLVVSRELSPGAYLRALRDAAGQVSLARRVTGLFKPSGRVARS